MKDPQPTTNPAPVGVPQAGWEERIKKTLTEEGEDIDDQWLDAPLSSGLDEKGWTW